MLVSAQYAGTWYEYTKNRRYFTIMDSGYRCVTETYTFTGNDTISIVNKGNRVLYVVGVLRNSSSFLLHFEFV